MDEAAQRAKQKLTLERYFVRHGVRKYSDLGAMGQVLVWGRADSVVGRLNYRTDGETGHLFVTGDTTPAIYRFSGVATLENLAPLEIGYFHSRMAASPVGCWPISWADFLWEGIPFWCWLHWEGLRRAMAALELQFPPRPRGPGGEALAAVT